MQVEIPTLETERLTLRGPRIEDTDAFAEFLASDRSEFVGGPCDARVAMRAYGHIAGLWVMRGVSSFIATPKGDDRPIGSFGPWHPWVWPELELGWSVWSAEDEGRGYVTEAMRTIIPWTYARTGLDTAVSFIDEGNDGSVRVAKALGATLDREMTARMNREDSPIYRADRPVEVWRHRKGRLQ